MMMIVKEARERVYVYGRDLTYTQRERHTHEVNKYNSSSKYTDKLHKRQVREEFGDYEN